MLTAAFPWKMLSLTFLKFWNQWNFKLAFLKPLIWMLKPPGLKKKYNDAQFICLEYYTSDSTHGYLVPSTCSHSLTLSQICLRLSPLLHRVVCFGNQPEMVLDWTEPTVVVPFPLLWTWIWCTVLVNEMVRGTLLSGKGDVTLGEVFLPF